MLLGIARLCWLLPLASARLTQALRLSEAPLSAVVVYGFSLIFAKFLMTPASD